MKTFKRIMSIVLVVLLVFSFTSCGKDNTPVAEFDNPFEGMTYTEVKDKAQEINEGRTYATESNSTFEVTSVKAKKFVFSGLAAVTSAVSILIAFTIGGVYTTPSFIYASKGEKILEVKIEYTNNSTESVMIGDVVHTVFATADDNLFQGVCCYPKKFKLDFSNTAIIKPGETKKFRLLYNNIPEEMIDNHREFNICFDIEGKVYSMMYVGN